MEGVTITVSVGQMLESSLGLNSFSTSTLTCYFKVIFVVIIQDSLSVRGSHGYGI